MEFVGREFSFEIGKYVFLVNGVVFVRYGDIVVFVIVCVFEKFREGINFFLFIVDYEERLYFVGKISGGFIKREGKFFEKVIFFVRLIDRFIRLFFLKDFYYDVFVIVIVLLVDFDNLLDVFVMFGLFVVLLIFDILFEGLIGFVFVGYVDGKIVINLMVKEREVSKFYFVVLGIKDRVMMIEVGVKEVFEDIMFEVIMIV